MKIYLFAIILLLSSILSIDIQLDAQKNFQLSYTIKDNTLYIKTTFQIPGFIAIGFKDNMINLDLLASIWEGDDKFNVNDYFTRRYTVPTPDDKNGGFNNAKNIKFERLDNNKGVQISFERSLITGDYLDIPLILGTTVKASAVWHDGVDGIVYHGENKVFFDMVIKNIN